MLRPVGAHSPTTRRTARKSFQVDPRPTVRRWRRSDRPGVDQRADGGSLHQFRRRVREHSQPQTSTDGVSNDQPPELNLFAGRDPLLDRRTVDQVDPIPDEALGLGRGLVDVNRVPVPGACDGDTALNPNARRDVVAIGGDAGRSRLAESASSQDLLDPIPPAGAASRSR